MQECDVVVVAVVVVVEVVVVVVVVVVKKKKKKKKRKKKKTKTKKKKKKKIVEGVHVTHVTKQQQHTAIYHATNNQISKTCKTCKTSGMKRDDTHSKRFRDEVDDKLGHALAQKAETLVVGDNASRRGRVAPRLSIPTPMSRGQKDVF